MSLLSCDYYPACGGCQTLHWQEAFYRDQKCQKVKDAFKAYGLEAPLGPLVALGPGLRRRASFKLEKGRIGFYGAKSHQLIPLQSCPVLTSELSEILKSLKPLSRWFTKADIEVVHTHTGMDVNIVTKTAPKHELKQLEELTAFIKKQGLARLSVNQQLFLCLRQPTVLLDDVPVDFSPGGFLQSSILMEETLKSIVQNHVGNSVQPLKILDLFCGRGTLSLPLSRLGKVTGYESDSQAVVALNAGAQGASRRLTAYERDLFKDPILACDLMKYDVIVLNPPRAGALKQIKELAQIPLKNLIYVSCNPESLARDCSVLENHGKVMTAATPIDAFFGSTHVEVVAQFRDR